MKEGRKEGRKPRKEDKEAKERRQGSKEGRKNYRSRIMENGKWKIKNINLFYFKSYLDKLPATDPRLKLEFTLLIKPLTAPPVPTVIAVTGAEVATEAASSPVP